MGYLKFFILITFFSCSIGKKKDSNKEDERRNYVDEYDSATAWGKVNGKSWTFVSGRALVPTYKTKDPLLRFFHFFSEEISNPCDVKSDASKGMITLSSSLETGEVVIEKDSNDTWINFIDPTARADERSQYGKKGKFAVDEITDAKVKGRLNGFSSRENFVTGTFEIALCPKEIAPSSTP